MTEVRIAVEVWGDAFLGYEWYESRSQGLGADFMQAVHETLDRIKRNPLQFPVVEGSIRRARTRRFPDGVFFCLEDGDAVVPGIEDLRKATMQWKSRL
ncbi:MAG: hypothetical protein FWD61_09115 [Phycisphaerales bacterium]|nr:hypothetical protein [Phycisphaerales bacterium]